MIRRAVERDLIKILEIYNEAVLNTTAVYSYNAQSLDDRTLWFQSKSEDQLPVLVFEENDEVFGFGTYGPFRAWPAYKYTIEHSVYVDKGSRNLGIGSALVKAIINLADEQKIATIVAGIDALNENSIRMHVKLGFEYSGTIKRAGYKFGKWLDLALYQMNLRGPQDPSDD